MKALWNNQVIAESDDTIFIEGNHYFPTSSVNKKYLAESTTHSTCPWKGEASYFNVAVEDQVNQDAGWYYPNPKPTAIEIVKKDFSGYVAFWRGVDITN
jgi:uncharacterized protein (DUF427 family)